MTLKCPRNRAQHCKFTQRVSSPLPDQIMRKKQLPDLQREEKLFLCMWLYIYIYINLINRYMFFATLALFLDLSN